MKPLILIVAGVCFLLLRRPWPAAAEELQTTVHPADTGAVLENPGMGWVLHFYDNVPRNYGSKLAPSDTVDDFPGPEERMVPDHGDQERRVVVGTLTVSAEGVPSLALAGPLPER